MASTPPTVAEYLIRRLQDHGVEHVFGVPGDYVLQFYDQLARSPITVVGTTIEGNAGFAADAYARIRGMGAVCITYCVGGLNAVNAIAGAFAEKSPVVVISGAPGRREREKDPLLHHKVRTFTTQYEIFQRITCAATVLDDEATALAEIDRVLAACQHQKRPGYIELPRDMVNVRPPVRHRPAEVKRVSDPDALAEALAEAVALLNAAECPVILADVEIHRFGLQQELLQLVEQTGIPVAATILGKSVVSERHPLYLGIYEGAVGRAEVKEQVEAADCLLMLGTFLTDVNLGIFTAKLERARAIEITSEKVQIHHHRFEGIEFADFLHALLRADLRPRPGALSPPGAGAGCPAGAGAGGQAVAGAGAGGQAGRGKAAAKADAVAQGKEAAKADAVAQGKEAKEGRAAVPGEAASAAPLQAPLTAPLTVDLLFARLNDFLTDDMIVIADVGDCLFGATDLVIHRRTEFLASAYYTSMGFAVPAALGAQFAAPEARPLVLVGDGAFQMTGMELSTIAYHKQNPIVVVLNNHGYTTERFILEGPYNDIAEWHFEKLPQLLGAGTGYVVRTLQDLDLALIQALADKGGFSILNCHLEKMDHSSALGRLGQAMEQKLKDMNADA